MDAFEKLKALVEAGVRFAEPYKNEPDLYRYARLSVGRGAEMLSYHIPMEDWEANGHRVKLMIHELHAALEKQRAS